MGKKVTYTCDDRAEGVEACGRDAIVQLSGYARSPVTRSEIKCVERRYACNLSDHLGNLVHDLLGKTVEYSTDRQGTHMADIDHVQVTALGEGEQ